MADCAPARINFNNARCTSTHDTASRQQAVGKAAQAATHTGLHCPCSFGRPAAQSPRGRRGCPPLQRAAGTRPHLHQLLAQNTCSRARWASFTPAASMQADNPSARGTVHSGRGTHPAPCSCCRRSRRRSCASPCRPAAPLPLSGTLQGQGQQVQESAWRALCSPSLHRLHGPAALAAPQGALGR